MTEEKKANMVLRTVYLPKDLDNKLRDYAFRKNRSKGDLMRELIQESLARAPEPLLKKKDEAATDKPKKAAPSRRKNPDQVSAG